MKILAIAGVAFFGWWIAMPILFGIMRMIGLYIVVHERRAHVYTLFGKVVAEVPRLLEQAERTALALAEMARGGLRLDDDTVERLAAAQAHHGRWTRLALWVGARALTAIAVWLIVPVG